MMVGGDGDRVVIIKKKETKTKKGFARTYDECAQSLTVV